MQIRQNESHERTADRLVDSHRPIDADRIHYMRKNMARQSMQLLNNENTRNQAWLELEAYNKNLESMKNSRKKMAEHVLDVSMPLDPLTDILERQNDQIKKGRLTLEEIKGK